MITPAATRASAWSKDVLPRLRNIHLEFNVSGFASCGNLGSGEGLRLSLDRSATVGEIIALLRRQCDDGFERIDINGQAEQEAFILSTGSTDLSTSSLDNSAPFPTNGTSSTPLGTGLSAASQQPTSIPHSVNAGNNTTPSVPLGTGLSSTSKPFNAGNSSVASLPGTGMSSITHGSSLTTSSDDAVGTLVTAANATGLAIGNTTIFAGGAPFTDATQTVSLAPSGTLVVDGSTTTIDTSMPSPGDSTGVPSLTPVSGTAAVTTSLVTSTMTTLPPGLSTEAYTGTITGNEWLTTTASDSSTTIVPVILPCPECAAIIIWGLPALAAIEFAWPQFPELPKFHLPCIQVFGATLAGECDAPPVNDAPPEDPQTTQNPSSTVSTSSATCTQSTTVTDCAVACSSTATDASSTCYTTSCSTVSGCSVTGTTTTSYTSGTCGPLSMYTEYSPADPNAPLGTLIANVSDATDGPTSTPATTTESSTPPPISTTESPPPPTTPTPTPLPAPTPTARFMLHLDVSEYEALTHNYWYAYSPSITHTYDICSDSIDTLDADQSINPNEKDLAAIPYPDGEFKIRGKVSGAEGCVYRGTADAPGTFECEDVPMVQCFADPQAGTEDGCVFLDGSIDTIYFKVRCDWA